MERKRERREADRSKRPRAAPLARGCSSRRAWRARDPPGRWSPAERGKGRLALLLRLFSSLYLALAWSVDLVSCARTALTTTAHPRLHIVRVLPLEELTNPPSLSRLFLESVSLLALPTLPATTACSLPKLSTRSRRPHPLWSLMAPAAR